MRNEHEEQGKRIEHVILETTGLADPTPILQLITQGVNKQGNDQIVQNYYINGIITLIDVVHFYSTLSSIQQQDNQKYKNEIIAQLLTTDYIILNKVDLLQDKEKELQDIEAFIRKHNTAAKIVSTSYSKLPSMEDIIDLRPDCDYKETLNNIQPNATIEANKKHDPSIEQTMVIASGGTVDIKAVQEFIKKETFNPDIYRIKGVLYSNEDKERKFIIQGVGQDQFTITKGNKWESDEVKESRLTFIGKNVLKRCKELEQGFKTCLLL